MQLIKEPNKLTVKYSSVGLGAVLMAVGAALLYQFYLQYTAHPNNFTEQMKGLAAGGGFLLFCGWLVAGQKIYTFDKVSGKFSWVRRKFFYCTKGDIKLSEIKRVVVEKSGMQNSQETTRISIWTDYKTIPFTAGMTAKGLADYSLAKEIKSFIGLREEEEPDMPPLEPRIDFLLGAGNKVDAIKLMRRENNMPLNEAHKRVMEMMKAGIANGSSANIVTTSRVIVNGKEVTGDEADKVMEMMQSRFGRDSSPLVENKESPKSN